MASNGGYSLIFFFILLQASLLPSASPDDQLNSGLEYDFYRDSCPIAESIIKETMKSIALRNPRAPAQLLRLIFHDCFIRGCDASVMLNDSNGNESHLTERDAIPNKSLKGFAYIDMIKAELEQECPGIVSCSDILVVAARDGVVLAGGPFYPVLTGRKDSLASFFGEALTQIPSPMASVARTLDLFSLRGFNEREVVSLLGAHNIGHIGCNFIRQRISNFLGTGEPDPSISANFLLELREKCLDSINESPSPSPMGFWHLTESVMSLPHSQSLASFVHSGTGFDSHYYKSLIQGRGLLYADQQLMDDPRTARLVEEFASNDGSFREEFARSMVKLSNLGTLTALHGEVRIACSMPNNKAINDQHDEI